MTNNATSPGYSFAKVKASDEEQERRKKGRRSEENNKKEPKARTRKKKWIAGVENRKAKKRCSDIAKTSKKQRTEPLSQSVSHSIIHPSITFPLSASFQSGSWLATRIRHSAVSLFHSELCCGARRLAS